MFLAAGPPTQLDKSYTGSTSLLGAGEAAAFYGRRFQNQLRPSPERRPAPHPPGPGAALPLLARAGLGSAQPVTRALRADRESAETRRSPTVRAALASLRTPPPPAPPGAALRPPGSRAAPGESTEA